MRWAFVIPAAILAAALGTAALARAGIGSEHSSVTLGTANGLSLSGQQLSMAAAGAASSGAITTGSQTIAGAKTFTDNFAVSKSSGTALFTIENTGGGASSMYFFSSAGSYFGYEASFNVGTATFVGGPITERTSWDSAGLMTVKSGMKLGSSGTTVSESKRFTTTVDLASIPAHSTLDTVIAATGADTTSECSVGSPGLEDGLQADCRVVAADTIELRVGNLTTGAIDPANQAFSVRYWEP